MLARLCSISFKLALSSTWTKNFQMYKQISRRQRNQKSNNLLDHGESKEVPENIYVCFIDYTKVFVWITTNWKILKEMDIPDYLPCLLKNQYAGQEATVWTGRGTTDWFQIGKGLCQGCILSPSLFNLYAEYIMRNVGLDEAQAGIKISRRNISPSDMQMPPPLWQKAKRNCWASWWKWKRTVKKLA